MYNQVLLLNPEYPWLRQWISLTYLQQGNPERALAEIDKVSPDNQGYHSVKANVLFTLGKEMESQAIADKFLKTRAQEYPLEMAIIYAWRGENDSAFEWLDEAFEQRRRGLANILFYDAFARLENDSRHPVFLEKLGLREYWEAMPKPDNKQ